MITRVAALIKRDGGGFFRGRSGPLGFKALLRLRRNHRARAIGLAAKQGGRIAIQAREDGIFRSAVESGKPPEGYVLGFSWKITRL